MKGLTLLEVLIVVTVLSVLSLSLYTVFKSGVEAWSKSETRLEIYQNARAILDQMSRELAGAFVGGDVEFRGEADELEFVTNYSDSIYKIKYELGDDNTLKRKYIENPVDYTSADYANKENGPDGTDQGIIDFGFMINDIQFEYWDGDIWDDDWSSPNVLPGAVKVVIELVDSDDNAYPFETMVYLPNSETGG